VFLGVCTSSDLSGRGDLVQRSFISTTRRVADFKLGQSRYVYYDARASGFRDAASMMNARNEECLLRNAHVEWFIEDREDYRNSLLFDTKYSGWSSREALKSMGYLVNYGVRKGAVIFNGPIDQDRLLWRVLVEGLLEAKLPALDGRFWMLSLYPNQRSAGHNDKVLKAFVEAAL
jgi:hypothetical protein